MGDKFLMLFGGWIGDLFSGYFVGDFTYLGVVCVGVCVSVWTTTLDLSPFPTSCWAGAWKIWPSVVFFRCFWIFGQSLASNWFNFSTSVLYCVLHWFYPSSVQQRCRCFLPCNSLQFSLLPGRTHSSCASPQLFPFLLVNNAKSCINWMILSAVCTGISFKQYSSIWSGSFLPHLVHTCHPLQASLWCPYVWHLKHLKGVGMYGSTLLRQ